MNLKALGWDAGWGEVLSGVGLPDCLPARVVNEDRHAYTVVGEQGELSAVVAGKLFHHRRSPADLPKVGDWVAVARMPGELKVVIHSILPRRTQLLRQAVGRAADVQVIAANVDVVFIVQALDQSFSRRRLERFLVMVREGGSTPVVVLNKADLRDELPARQAEAEAAAAGARVIVASAKTGKGLGELRAELVSGRTVCFLGTSGVGKSSLINRLNGEAIQDTLPVRAEDSKGRHATTRREIIPLPGGALVIDTPGMREFHLWLADSGLDESFPELFEIGKNCRFRDCSHGSEPGCAVRLAVESGKISPDRYGSFKKLQAELDATTRRLRDDTHARNRHRFRTGTRAYQKPSRESPPLTEE